MNYNLEHFIQRAFVKSGHEVKFIGFKNEFSKHYFEYIRMLSSRSYIFRNISSPFWLKKLNDIYFEGISSFSPDLVLSIKGETLAPKTLKKIEKELGIKTMLWYPDDPRFFKPLVRHISPHYDKIFTCSHNALEIYRSIGVDNAKRIPFGCDSEIHNDNSNGVPMINKALFIGAFSAKRYRFIRSLVNEGIPIDIVGPHWPPIMLKNVISKGLFGKQYIEYIKKYSVILNLHQDINYGPNMRTFEVTGSGGILLSDSAEDISSFFSDREEIYIYNDINEAKKLINEILRGEINREKMSKKAHYTCHMKYSYERRAMEILM